MSKNDKNKYNISFDDLADNSIASNTEITGMIQTPPLSKSESRSYSGLADIPKQKKSKKKK